MLRIKGPGGRVIWRAALPALTALLVALVVVPAASAAPTPFTDIHSAGPLSDIYIGNDLSCQVRSGGFSSTEFFPNAAGSGDCGTFFNTGSDTFQTELLGPDFANHQGGTHTSFSSEVPFTPIRQSSTGLGTSASPYQVTTVVQATGSPSTDWPVGGPPVHGGRYLHRWKRLLPNGHHGFEHRSRIDGCTSQAVPRR